MRDPGEFEGQDATGIEFDASFDYAFPAFASEDSRVGVCVPAEVIEKLRRLNTDAKGALYQQDGYKKSVAVALCQDSPVDGLGTQELERLSRQMRFRAREASWSQFEYASQLLWFAQRAIPYSFDEDSTAHLPGGPYEEYGRFALETLVDGTGDCECTALLCASVLAYAGFHCALILVRIEGNEFEPSSGHAAVGLMVKGVEGSLLDVGLWKSLPLLSKDGRDYLYGETAIDSDQPEGFGYFPESWRDRMEIREIVPISPYRRRPVTAS